MKILETFDQFLKRNNIQILEQLGEGRGFIAVIGSTDSQNLLAGSANPIGIEQDTVISLKIDGVDEMVRIGAAKKFENITKGKKVKPGSDYLTILIDGKKYTVNETGSISIPFNNQTVFEVEGSGNGLLALLRALHYLNVAVTKNSFDHKSSFDGIMMIKLGEVTRKGMGLSVNGKYTESNSLRITTGYANIVKKYIIEALSADQKPKEIQSSSSDQIVVSSDSIADAIKAGHFLKNNIKWNSRFSSFLGFNEMKNIGIEEPPSWYLAVAFQYCLSSLSDFYPMNLSKIYNVDLQPYAEKILSSQPKDIKSFEGESIKDQLSAMLKIFQPKSLEDYPEFDEFLPKYWEIFSNAVINRVLLEMPRTYGSAMENFRAGKVVQTTGGIGKGEISHGSGKVDN